MNNIDILRAFAIFAVFAHHLAHVYHIQIPFFHQHGGWFGVQLFFLLSGYLIVQSAEKYQLRVYFTHRILRIFPAYLVCYLILGWYQGVITFERIVAYPIGFILNLTLLQQLQPKATLTFDVLHTSWTLTIELCWYICAPLLIKPLRHFPNSILILSCMFATLWTWLATHHHLDWIFTDPTRTLSEGERYLFLNNAFPAQLCFFIIGAYIYFQRDFLVKQNPFILTSVSLFILSSWSELSTMTTNPNFISGIGLGALMVVALQAPVWRCLILKWIANISYSIYLLHFPLLVYIFHTLNFSGYLGAFSSLLFILVIATLNYMLIEKPAMNLARRWLI